MRNRPLDPATEQALAELEAALAGSPDADPGLAALVADVRDTRPEADPGFLSGLERDIAGGFGRQERPRRRLPSFRILAPAGATALAAAVVAVILSGSAGENPSTPVAAVTESASKAARSSAGATADESAAPAPVAPQAPTGGDETARVRQVERSAALTLAATERSVQETSGEVIATTTRLGGYVAQSSLSVRDGQGSASLTLRVPTQRLDAAMAALSRLGEVRATDQQQLDITSTFNAAEAELQEARAERAGLLSALRRSTDEAQVARLRQRLRENRARIATAGQALASVRSRASRATIAVEIVSAGASRPATAEQGFGLGAAARAAVAVLSASAGVLLLVLAAALPLAFVTVTGLLAMRGVRRRRRERALDDRG